MEQGISFEFPHGVSGGQDRRYVVLSFVDLWDGTQKIFENTVNKIASDARMVTELFVGYKAQDAVQSGIGAVTGVDTSRTEPIPEGAENESYLDQRERIFKEVGAPQTTISHSFAGSRGSRNSKGKLVFAVALPHPDTFKESSTQTWSQEKGLVQGLTSSLLNHNIGSTGMNLSKFIGWGQSQAGARKPIVNPKYFQDYEGPSPRTFQFQWTLAPNSVAEMRQIALIIYNIKKFTSPKEQIGGYALLAPYHVNISMYSKVMDNVQSMDLLVCTGVDIDWGPNTHMLPDGTPREVTLSMSFIEKTALTADDYDSGSQGSTGTAAGSEDDVETDPEGAGMTDANRLE